MNFTIFKLTYLRFFHWTSYHLPLCSTLADGWHLPDETGAGAGAGARTGAGAGVGAGVGAGAGTGAGAGAPTAAVLPPLCSWLKIS